MKKSYDYSSDLKREIKRKKEIIFDVLQNEGIYQEIVKFRTGNKIPKNGYNCIDFTKDSELSEINKELFGPIEYLEIPIQEHEREVLVSRWPEILTLADDICNRKKLDKDYRWAIFDFVLFNDISDSSIQPDILFEAIPQEENNEGDFIYDQFEKPQLSEKDKKYPFRISFGPLARQKDIINFIKSKWSLIELHQEQLLRGKKPRVREKTTRDIRTLVWANRDKSISQIEDLIKEEFGDLKNKQGEDAYGQIEIQVILSQEKERREK